MVLTDTKKAELLQKMQSKHGVDLFAESIMQDDLEEFKFLVENGADVNNYNILGIISNKGYFEMVQYLVDKGVNVNEKDSNGDTSLHHAIMGGSYYIPEIVKILVDKGADINAKNNDNMSPLHFASIYNGNLEVVSFLVDKGANVNVTTINNWTPLHFAAYNGNLEIVKFLVEKHSDPNAKNNSNQTPFDIAFKKRFDIASKKRHEAIVNFLRPLTNLPPERIIEDKLIDASTPEYVRELLENRIACSICGVKEKKIAFSCGHMTCASCSKILETTFGNKCPECNEPIENKQVLFYKKYLKYKNKYLALKNTL